MLRVNFIMRASNAEQMNTAVVGGMFRNLLLRSANPALRLIVAVKKT